jgi:hypothetical protein
MTLLEARPAIQNLTPERYRAALREQLQRLDALEQRGIAEFTRFPNSRLSRKALTSRVQTMFTRLDNFLAVDPHGIPDIVDAWSRKRDLSYSRNANGEREVNEIKINVTPMLDRGGMLIHLWGDGSLLGKERVVTVNSMLEPGSYFEGTDNRKAMQIAEVYFDAHVGPFEEAVGLTGGKPKPGDGFEAIMRDGSPEQRAFLKGADRIARRLGRNPTGIAPDNTHLIR